MIQLANISNKRDGVDAFGYNLFFFLIVHTEIV